MGTLPPSHPMVTHQPETPLNDARSDARAALDAACEAIDEQLSLLRGHRRTSDHFERAFWMLNEAHDALTWARLKLEGGSDE